MKEKCKFMSEQEAKEAQDKWPAGTQVRVKRTDGTVEDNWMVVYNLFGRCLVVRTEDAYKRVSVNDLEEWSKLEV